MAGALLRSVTRPRIVFPNLEYLAWNVGGPQMLGWESLHLLFLHPGVRRVGLQALVPGNVDTAFGSLADVAAEIAEMSPNMIQVDVTTTTREVAGLDEPLLPLLSIATLTQVNICQSLFTPFVLETLSLLPNLRSLLAIDPDVNLEHANYDPVSAADFSRPLVLAPGAYGALKKLHLVMPTANMSSLLNDTCFPATQLHELRVRVLDSPTSDATSTLISTIATRCGQLQALIMNLYPPDFIERSTVEQILSPLTASMLAPLRSLKELEAIFIHHLMPVSLSNEELFHLLAGLPSLTRLFLVPRPDYWPNPPDQPPVSCFDWQTLILLAQKYPQITRLGLYVNLTGPAPSAIPSRFPALGILELGTSPCPPLRSTRAKLATALCGILSGRTVLASGFLKNSTWNVNPPVYADPSFEADLARWAEVRTLVHFGLALISGASHDDICKDD